VGAIDRLRAAAAGRGSPVLRVIAATSGEHRVDGADACIARPLTIQKLAETLPMRWPWV